MEELFARFPEMQPIGKPPTLTTINGFGTTIYGSRDHDPESGTYVKTLWFVFAFIPLIPLAAYRVANAPNGGWYFLGRVPVARGPKLWLLALVLLGLSLGGGLMWHHHTTKPEYQAGKKLDQAEQARQQGELGKAASLYREVAQSKTEHAPKAIAALGELTEDDRLRNKDTAMQALDVFRAARDIRHERGGVPNLFERGEKFAVARVDEDPQTALGVLEALDAVAPTPESGLAVKEKALEKLVKEQPDNVDLIVKLAVIYDRGKHRPRCEALLKPHEKKLADTEGARILGRIYSEQGKFEEAFALLQPYTDKRLKAYLDAEEQMQKAYKITENLALEELRGGTAKDFPFDRYKRAGKGEQEQLVQQYMIARFRDSPDIKRLQETIRERGTIVPVAFDLGIVQLRRAQQMADPAARKAELERSEKTFRSLHGALGETPRFRLSLGQVYYWMGKQDEGRKLFDEVLKAEGRTYELLIGLASLLRELGEVVDSRKLSEEAHGLPDVAREKRQEAAFLRALTAKDLEDKIDWLEKANASSPEVKATLATARGQKAMQEGKDAEAVPFFRETVAIYAAQPEDAATLNNSALASLSLYSATGDKEALDEGVRKMEKAATLQPRDGILVSNVAGIALGSALRDLVSERIDLKVLKRRGSLDLLSHLHQDKEGRAVLVKQVKESPGVRRAQSHFERGLVLAPQRMENYAQLLELLRFLGDQEGLRRLKQRATEAKLNLEEQKQHSRDHFVGKKDEKTLREMDAANARAERLVNETRAAGGVTFAVAATSLVSARLSLETMARNVDGDALVTLAEEAHKAAPSSATVWSLKQALLARASRTLAGKEPEYAAMVKKARRSLGSTDLIAVALWREGKPRQAALDNEDVKRVIALVREGEKRYPDTPDEWSWAMLKAAQPEEAVKLAEGLKANEMSRLYRQLSEQLSPLSAAHALRACWALDAAGQHKEALAVLKRCAAEGVPMPFDLP